MSVTNSANTDKAEIWIEVDGKKLEMVTDKDGKQVAIIDYDSEHRVKYCICVQPKHALLADKEFGCSSLQLSIDGKTLPKPFGNRGRRIFEIDDDQQGNTLGFAPLKSSPTQANVSAGEMPKYGVIKARVQNAKWTSEEHIRRPRRRSDDAVSKSQFAERKYAPEGKGLYRLHTTVCNEAAEYTQQCQVEYGSLTTMLVLKYAGRQALEIAGVLKAPDEERLNNEPSKVVDLTHLDDTDSSSDDDDDQRHHQKKSRQRRHDQRDDDMIECIEMLSDDDSEEEPELVEVVD